jgi:serine/threonine-protein kinase
VAATLESLRTALGDRYLIEREIGQGGMAVVYLARDIRHDRAVALKVLRPELAPEVGAERFLREIRVTAALQHSHILPLLDSGAVGGLLYYVMPFVEGESLRDRLELEKQLSVDEALRLTSEIADALEYAHQQGVIHRDIKPENVLISRGHAWIADFGIARALSESSSPRLTTTGILLGTPLYMSPEQAAGGSSDGRADQYALACMLYEMLTGQPPFVGSTAESLVHQHLSVSPRAVTELRPAVPPGVAGAIARALAKNPADRFPTTGQFALAITPTTQLHPAPEARQGSPRWVGVAGATLATLAVLLLLFLSNRGWRDRLLAFGIRGTAVRSLAVLPIANLSGDPSQEFFADGMTEELIATVGRIASLKVTSRTSVMRYKGTRKSMPEIGRELGVDAVIEGSVLRSGDRVRVTAQLIRAATDQHLWAATYDRDLQDLLILQSEVARAITEEIRAALTPAEKGRLASAAVVDPETHDLYLRARYLWNERKEPAISTAIALLKKAVARDPRYALAYAALADCYVVLSPPSDLFRANLDRARFYAQKALAIDPQLAEPHAVMGMVAEKYWDLNTEEKELRRAIELNPNYGTAHQWYAIHLRIRGRLAEGRAELERALALDPLSRVFRFNQGIFLYSQRQYELAAEENRQLIELDPSWSWPHEALHSIRAAQGDWVGARAAQMELFRLTGDSVAIQLARRLPHARNRQEFFQQELDILRQASGYAGSRVPPAAFAIVYAATGDRDRAFEWLEKTARGRPTPDLPELADPWFDSLRTDPRYAAYCRRFGLGPPPN